MITRSSRDLVLFLPKSAPSSVACSRSLSGSRTNIESPELVESVPVHGASPRGWCGDSAEYGREREKNRRPIKAKKSAYKYALLPTHLLSKKDSKKDEGPYNFVPDPPLLKQNSTRSVVYLHLVIPVLVVPYEEVWLCVARRGPTKINKSPNTVGPPPITRTYHAHKE